MWCPKCKAEYRDGITACPECNVPLVESLPDAVDISSVENKINLLNDLDSKDHLQQLSDGNHSYVEKGVKYEDMKSTAFSFLLVGCLGIILLILIYSGVIPLRFAEYMKYMMSIVMGGIFLAFLVIGMRSYARLSDLKAQMLTEQQNREEAERWFFGRYSADAVDASANVSAADELQQKYFQRSSCMKASLHENFPDYEDSFLDYLTEQFYEKLYPRE